MKSIKKISITLLSFSLAAGLLLSCSSSTSPEKSETATTGEAADTPDSNTPDNTSGNTSTNPETNGITYSTTYTEPSLPDGVENAPQLQMNYLLGLGNENNLIINLSGSDTETNRFFSEEIMARSISLTTSSTFDDYTLQTQQ